MAVVVTDLKAYVGSTSINDQAALERALALAVVLVDEFVYGAYLVDDLRPLPTVVLDEAYLLVAAELFERQEKPDGMYESGGPVMRTTRDPLKPALGLLRRWLVTF